MAAQPTISAIITTFNYAAFIADALDSVFRQTRVPDEIVVVDDGSTDETAAIVARYAERGVRYVYQPNQGAGAARNRGLAETSGDLVAFLDADDMWMPGKTEQQLNWLVQRPSAVLVSGQRVLWDVEQGKRTVERLPPMSRVSILRQLTYRNVIGNPSMTLIRRSAIEQVGPFNVSLRWAQDWEMFIRLARVGAVGVLPDPVVIYRWHSLGLSHNQPQERLAVVHGVARWAIDGFEPRWMRPVLRLRAWNAIEYERAKIAIRLPAPRLQQVRHTGLAFASWPFADTFDKLRYFGRALVGESTYQRALSGYRARVRSPRASD